MQNEVTEPESISWIYQLKKQVPEFLHLLRGKQRPGFYHYSLTGDYLGERFKWGLGNTVFFLKIAYTIGLPKTEEVQDAINYVQEFQDASGYFHDPFVRVLSFPFRTLRAIRNHDIKEFSNLPTQRAETRQAISALALWGQKPKYEFTDFPKSESEVGQFLSGLDWTIPWAAGSHFSHLVFFLHSSSWQNKDNLIKFAIDWVNELQHSENGFWYTGQPSTQQKINGAMKVITALKAADRVEFEYPQELIDQCLAAKNDTHACDNFNITYVLKYCHSMTQNQDQSNDWYRSDEIERFMYDRLEKYRQFYHPEYGGFSFNPNCTKRFYYQALFTKGKNEPDIHGTVMFLWGISLIAQVLELNSELEFSEFVT